MPYKKVIAIGDSFTRGDELADCPEQILAHFNPIQHSSSTWPALVAQHLGADYECIATGGRGNQWISWQVSRILHRLRQPLLIINWSWFERFDYVEVDKGLDTWHTTHPRHEDKLNHYFYKNIDNELWNVHRNLQQIHSTISLLQQNKIDFIMTCPEKVSLEDILDKSTLIQKRYSDWQDSIKALQKQTSHYIVNFYGYTFLEWTELKNFDIGPGGHPLEKAHIEAAKYINTHTIEGKINGHR